MSCENRYASLDIIKAVCIFLVIIIHIQVAGQTSPYVLAIARIAVPLFLMISGFFYSEVCSRGGKTKQLLKIAKMYIGANILYFVWQLVSRVPDGTFSEFMTGKVLTAQAACNFFVFGESPFASHIWYLSAFLYVLLVFFPFGGNPNTKVLIVLTPLLLLAGLLIGRYPVVLWGRKFSYLYTRNFILTGIPYFSLGIIIRKYEDKIRLSNISLILLSILFIITTVVARFIFGKMNIMGGQDLYASTTLLSLVLFLLAVKNPEFGKGSFAEKIGYRYSADMYIWHVLFILIVFKIVDRWGMAPGYVYFAPVMIYVISVLFAMLLSKIKMGFRSHQSEA